MNSDTENEDDDWQWAAWEKLYAGIKTTLEKWGVEDCFGKADYLIVDDNYGNNIQKIEIHRLGMLDPGIVMALRQLLAGYPDWEIVIAVDIPGKEGWPPMGLTIRKHEIIDGLRREYLPKEYQNLDILAAGRGPVTTEWRMNGGLHVHGVARFLGSPIELDHRMAARARRRAISTPAAR